MSIKKIYLPAAVFIIFAAFLSAQAADPYEAFNTYRSAAVKGVAYPGAPLKGKVIGFANAMRTFPFCMHVKDSLTKQLALAGCNLTKGYILMDNQSNPATALKNASAMIARKPDFFVQYQLDEKTNNVIAAMFNQAGIPMFGIDLAIPGYTVIGTNNYAVADLAGHTMAKLIRKKWGSWNAVDLVVIMRGEVVTPHLELRTEGVVIALSDEFGIDSNDPKIVRAQGAWFEPAKTRAVMDAVLTAHPHAKRIALTSMNEQLMAYCISTMQAADRWDPENKVVVTMGVDEAGQSLIRRGLSDAGVAFFPEHYGEYIVPAIAAALMGNAVPPAAFVKNEVITLANIDRWYPE
jgi:ribose transport system substrate-binding protein